MIKNHFQLGDRYRTEGALYIIENKLLSSHKGSIVPKGTVFEITEFRHSTASSWNTGGYDIYHMKMKMVTESNDGFEYDASELITSRGDVFEVNNGKFILKKIN